MGIFYNSTNIPTTQHIYLNSQDSQVVFYNNTEVWRRQQTIYPGASVNWQNVGYASYGSVTNNGTTIVANTFGGTDAGSIRLYVGPFSTTGFGTLFLNISSVASKDTAHWIQWGLVTTYGSTTFSHKFYESNGHTFGGLSGLQSYSIGNMSTAYFMLAQSSSANYSGHELNTTISQIYLQ